MAVLEVAREDAFAPVKNGPGAASDSPETALAALSAQVYVHRVVHAALLIYMFVYMCIYECTVLHRLMCTSCVYRRAVRATTTFYAVQCRRLVGRSLMPLTVSAACAVVVYKVAATDSPVLVS
jgi:hypothetical protein